MLKFINSNTRGPLDPDEILADSISVLRTIDNLEGTIERPLGKFASFLFLICISVGMFYLMHRAKLLQVDQGERFFVKAQENRFLTRAVFPPRGIIYDRHGMPLLENVPSFGLLFEKEEFLRSGKQELRPLLDALGFLLKQDMRYFFDAGFPNDFALKSMPSRIVIAQNITPEMLVEIAAHPDAFPGVQIFESYQRSYKDAFAFSHLLGFLGKVSEDDLKKNPDLLREDTVGKSGLEAFYDEALHGRRGKKIVEIDSAGRETRFRLTEDPQEGMSIRLTIDGELERTAYNLLKNYTGEKKGGSIVALNPKTGEVLALVSFPGFDSNKFGVALSQKEFDATLKDPLSPLFNRAIGGEFPSGSIIKPLMAVAALEEGVIDPKKKIYDPGYIEIPNPYRPGEVSVFKDWRAHGWVDMYDALALSANVYFYMIGGGYKDQRGLGIERIKRYASLFGLGSQLGIDIPGERAGFIPDPTTKAEVDVRDPIWRVGDTYNVSIGQGGVRVTPLQMASITAALANGGTLYQPYILERVEDRYKKIIKERIPQTIRTNLAEAANIQQVQKGMEQAVTSGTARLLNTLPVRVAAKTGTAQAGTNKLPHAWVTAFGPVEDPEIAVVVMVEHAGEGSTVAVPITHELLQWYFNHRDDISPQNFSDNL